MFSMKDNCTDMQSILEIPSYYKAVQKLPSFVFFCIHSFPQAFHHYHLYLLLYYCLDKGWMLIHFSSEVNLILNVYLPLFCILYNTIIVHQLSFCIHDWILFPVETRSCLNGVLWANKSVKRSMNCVSLCIELFTCRS